MLFFYRYKLLFTCVNNVHLGMFIWEWEMLGIIFSTDFFTIPPGLKLMPYKQSILQLYFVQSHKNAPNLGNGPLPAYTSNFILQHTAESNRKQSC